jgi:hypothetical protein
MLGSTFKHSSTKQWIKENAACTLALEQAMVLVQPAL